MNNTLVTGGAGFIGSHVVERLIQEGHNVRVIDDFSTGKEENLLHLAGRVRIFRGSVLNRNLVAEAVKDCQTVIHLAAAISVPESIKDPARYMETNVVGSAIVLSCALEAGCRRAVLASSAAVYGTDIDPPHTEGLMSGFRSSPYAVSKLAMEDIGREFSKRGLTCISLRLFNVFGPRQSKDSGYAAAVPSFMGAIASGKNPTIFGDGNQTRDFFYVGNVAEAFFRAATFPGIGGSYNIGSGKPTTVKELCEAIIKASNSRARIEFGPERDGDIKRSYADISRAFKHLGLRELTTLSEGLALTWQWFSKQKIL